MKPDRIILVRHAESQGNVDAAVHAEVPNHKVPLSDVGRRQAAEVGLELRQIVGDDSVQFYFSPYERTRQTFDAIRAAFDRRQYRAFEDPRLREQDFGNLPDPQETRRLQQERTAYGAFFYRFPDGESGADVFDRVSSFFETLHRAFRQRDFPRNVILVTHGLTMRLFVMRWFHERYDEFETWANPGNGEYRVLRRLPEGPYRLDRPFDKRRPAAVADDLGLGRGLE